MKNWFHFPHPVNEIAARLVAGMVVIVAGAAIMVDNLALMVFLVYGFLARVVAGPTFSPMGLLATKVIVPLLGNPSRPVPGPPKRFAQAIGLIVSASALYSRYILDMYFLADTILIILVVFALLESVVGFCTGCYIFARLMQWGLIPAATCEKCNNIAPR